MIIGPKPTHLNLLYLGRFGLAVLSSSESSGFDALGKMVQIEEMTELNPSLSGIECGKSIFGEGTVSVQPRREGEYSHSYSEAW